MGKPSSLKLPKVDMCNKLFTCKILGRGAENQNGNLRWHLPLGVRPPPFFSFAIESYIYETDFTLQKYHF